MFGTVRKSASQLAAIDHVSTWVRARFKLDDGEALLVTEIVCALPGCPPLETVIAFWTLDERSGDAQSGAATRHHYKIFKPVLDVTEDDLPPSWMKRELAVSEDYQCSCC